MDFKKLGQLIAILGIGTLAVGVFIFGSNQPIAYVAPASTGSFFQQSSQMLDRFAEQVDAQSANYKRESKRNDAKKIMIAGGIVLFLGFAISASAKKTP